jgi:hypothetical protein
MRRDFDIFEKFHDGSILWRACARGRYEATRKMQELAEHSDNEFVVIDIQGEHFLPVRVKQIRKDSRPLARSAMNG